MGRKPLIALDLRRLFLGIARASLASSCLAACAAEHTRARPQDDEVEDPSASPFSDASLPPDVGSPDAEPKDAGPSDAGPNDAGPSDAAPNDGGVSDAGPRRDDWEAVYCPDTRIAQPKQTFALPDAVTYLGVYVRTSYIDGDGGVKVHSYARAQVPGAPCADAGDTAACNKRIAQLSEESPCSGDPCSFAIAIEAGQARRLEMRAELLAALGSIDSAAKAVLLTAFEGEDLCQGNGSRERGDIGSETRSVADGYELRTTRDTCSGGLIQKLHHIAADGGFTRISQVKLAAGCTTGRRPPGLCAAREAQAGSAAASFLADAARLEHASIYAFYQLIRELGEHGAPESLRLMALDAMLDEVQHAREVGILARAYGAETVRARVEQTALRSLLEIGLDNAGEGCVRETFGALLATYQADHAHDLRVKNVMVQIAEDETRHAALSWQLMAWLLPQLSETEQQQLETRRRETCAELRSELGATLPQPERDALGLPSAHTARLMLEHMERALFS